MSKPEKDSLGDRMKGYEGQYRFKLAPRSFVVVRLDGKAFHTYTKNFERPWDDRLVNTIQSTCRHLCETMSGAVLGYSQSDEISIVMAPGVKLTSEPWFDNNLQKIVSVSASICTSFFNKTMRCSFPIGFEPDDANFDSRAFVLPEDEVVNYLIWRQQDCTRNSVSMLARAHFSHSECHNKTTNDLLDMLMAKEVNWNEEETDLKRGACCRKIMQEVPVPEEWKKTGDPTSVSRGVWKTDHETPIFTKFRDYITNTWKARIDA